MKPKSEFPPVLANSSWPAFLVDDTGTIRHANESAVTVLGTVMEGESSLAASVWSSENAMGADEFLARLERSSVPVSALKFRVKGGAAVPFNTLVCPSTREGHKVFLFQLLPDLAPAAKPAAIEAEGRKSTEGAAAGLAETLAVQRHKLDCALQLSRTVALDFNNALTTILGHTSLILGRVEPSHPWRGSLMEVEKSAQKAAEIAHDLAEFSRQEKDATAHAPGNLNRILRRAVEVFQKPGGLGVVWTLQLEKRLFTVTFDEAKMQQAFGKILENAIEAVGREGRITVRTMNHSFDVPVVSPTLQLSAGHYVCMEVSDNGAGVPPELVGRVFEPFFTTKAAPHRGLGLAWVYGIVTNHGGQVSLVSPPGQGTTVRVFLPAQEKIVRDQPTKVDDLRGSQTVLVVDDEEMLLNLAQTVLTSFGYRVLTANSGARALDLFAQSTTKIDLLITDLVMPGMSGRELMDQLRVRMPRLPILTTSGYLRGSGETEDDNYLRKPFTAQELLRKVKQILLQSGVA
jgi:signal transduction histidine kinase